MTSNLFWLSWSVLFLVSTVRAQSSGNVGRCPRQMLDKKLCRGEADQCQRDTDCSGESLCCNTGCNRVCTLPSFTACDHSRYFFEKQVKLLQPEAGREVLIPKCTESGAFEEIQCNEISGKCYCVDRFGFEKGGTRANSREAVNCSRSNDRCSGPQCRMLCPYGFELDSDGCEMCICKDICKGVKCPGSLECQLQEVSCATEPCPPVPTCKKPRTLESLCSIGVPFTITETGNPFLCGVTPGKPTCPTGFNCNVKAGDDYGICCGWDAFYEKPGNCPTVSGASSTCDESSSESHCQSSCKHDLECPEMRKCCLTESRGKHCSDALNSTMCLQQRKIAEILSTKEIEGRGYIPQCDPNSGGFLMKQCSRNGKMCFCVDVAGRNIPRSLGPAELVDCTHIARRRDLVNGDSRDDACDINLCGNTCEFGYKTDEVTGCGTCDCNVDPCSTLNCPMGSKCSFTASKECLGPKPCQIQPICERVPNVLHVNPCDSGTPLFDHSSNQLVVCSENGATCPSSHVCVKASVNTDGLCCLNLPRLEPTKPGMCPFLSSSLCNGTLESDNKQCNSDKGCEGDLKCCTLPCGGAICADPLLDAQTESNKLPTMCQYLETVEMKRNDVLKNFKMAMEVPRCKSSGDFEEMQCNELWCYCVDEFGIEIDSTRVGRLESKLSSAYCLEMRRMPACLDMTCRLGCDYGYKTKDKCRICECANPCEGNSVCDEDHYCEMVDVDCSEGYCPAVPYCIPRLYAAITMSQLSKERVCPNGLPYFDPEMNETLTCRPRARMLQCPDDYFCHETDGNHDFGYCCPIIELADESISGKGEGNIPLISSGNILDDFPIHRKQSLTNCELARESQMETVLENHRVNYIPRCHPATGNWEPSQCIDEVNMCFCVNNHGTRIPGTITSGKPNCNARQSRGKFLGSTTKSEQAVCSDGENVHVCNKSLCEDRICMAYPDARCGIDPCGGCRFKFYDANNNVVDCGAGLGKCHKAAQQIMNSRVWINQQKQSGNSGDKDEFPESIEHLIDDVLQERLGRAAPDSSEFPTIGDMVAEVMKHGQSSFEQFGEKVTELFLRNGSPSNPISGFNTKFPAGGGILEASQFSDPTAASSSTFAAGIPMMMRKASCPQPLPNEILFRLTGTCIDLCNYDDECGHDERCCLVDCGYRCKKVVIEFQVRVVERSKGIKGLESVIGDDFEESNMLLNPPTCRGDGEYELTQHQGDLTWCVDNEGTPQPESLTRGHVVCSEQGKMIEKTSVGQICPSPDTRPMICTDQCMNSTCKGHPNAICVSDPCKNCKVSFFTPSGEKVLCEEKCQQKLDPGLCRASFPRYFYNVTSRQCEEFFWGGCQGNDNNFETLAECKGHCEREVDICALPVPNGSCQEKVERWYFDVELDTCQKFVGCADEGNNFPSKRHCESRCPIKVLCPNLVEGGLSICNRGEACLNLTGNCQGLKTTDYLCMVEPCSCVAELKYLDGRGLQCPEIKGDVIGSKQESQRKEHWNTEDRPGGRSYETEVEVPTLPTVPVDTSLLPRIGHPETGSLLVVRPGFADIKSRCFSMREKYFSKCDDHGNFVPTQCNMDEQPVCWCVNSIGNQLEGTGTFLAGSTACPSVAIEKVNVRLSFPASSAEDVSSSQLGIEVQDLLRSLDAELEENKVSVENIDGFTNIEFVLEGESSGQISHMLEEGLRRNLLGISVQDQFTLADLSTSRFHYIVPEISVTGGKGDVTTLPSEEAEVTTVDEAKVNENYVLGWDDGSVTAKEVNRTDEELNVVAIVLTVIAAITSVLIIIGLFLGLKNKKTVPNHPKNKFSSLPFSSPFILEKKEMETKCKI